MPPSYAPDMSSRRRATNHDRRAPLALLLALLLATAAASETDKTDRFLDKINEQSIAAVFNKVAYGSTTKRSIPDNAYLYTTFPTPLLTTYRYSDGNQEWYRVDVKEPEPPDERPADELTPDLPSSATSNRETNYGSELEKDHALPTSAPAADILKNNNNKNYNNPNRYNNDKLRPEPDKTPFESVTEREPPPRTSTGYSVLRNVRPTKSMFGKEVPSYVPPSRSFFTPPLPPEYLNPFADKPTLRGTNSDTYQNRRPIPPPSLMPKKDRIPFRPDLPPAVNENPPASNGDFREIRPPSPDQRKKTLNTPSQNVHFDRPGEFFGLNRLHNETNFEYEPMVNIPSISRILSGSNGRKEDIPDILLRTVTATPNRNPLPPRHDPPPLPPQPADPIDEDIEEEQPAVDVGQAVAAATIPKTNNRDLNDATVRLIPDTTTITTDILNLPNVKIKTRNEISNATKANNSHEIWHICWNVHVYLIVFLYILLAIFSIVKLIRFERETHMFSKSYFLAVHLLLTTVCVLRIFYLAYDPYNVNGSFGNFTYDLLHNFPLSLLATTFAVLIVFLLKRTLNHLKVKTRPVFLVLFGLGHMFLCFCLNLAESFDLFSRGSFLGLSCRFVYILLCWSLGLSYVYLYKIIKNVLAKKSQNLSEMCTQNISYASHITIAVALLFTLLGFVQLYGLFFIKNDRFTVPYHWILWGFELSVRLLEISIVTLLAIVVSLRMSQREKQNVGFPLFPCTTSDSSTDNIYPNNCSTNLNALNYSLRSSQAQYRQQQAQQQPVVSLPQQQQQDLMLDNIPTDIIERPNLLLDKKSTLDRCFPSVNNSIADRGSETASEHERAPNFDRFERPNWSGSQRFALEGDSFPGGHFDRGSGRFPSGHFENSIHGSGRLKPYEKCRYYAKPKYETADLYNSSSGGTQEEEPDPPRPQKQRDNDDSSNVYSEPLDVNGGSSNGEYERRYADLDRTDLERRSRTSWSNSGRRSTGRSARKAANRTHTAGVHTLPNQDGAGSMLVDENGFVRFRQLAGAEHQQQQLQQQHVQRPEHPEGPAKPRKHHRYHHDLNHYSDA